MPHIGSPVNGNQLGAALGMPIGLCLAGMLSGLFPVVNAEAVLTAAVLGARDSWLAFAAAVAFGQSAAKTMIFAGSRRGTARLQHRPASSRAKRLRKPTRVARFAQQVSARILPLLRRPVPGVAVVALSSVVGVPPLAATSVLAGIAQMRITLFYPACFGGRFLRFALIAFPLAHLLRR
jgi:membrane protein YqaA with SNARE-associated domain